MPYTRAKPPAWLKNLPEGAITLGIKAFNAALKDTGDEDAARKAAWTNIKRKYKKSGGEWVKKKTKVNEAILHKPIEVDELHITEAMTDGVDHGSGVFELANEFVVVLEPIEDFTICQTASWGHGMYVRQCKVKEGKEWRSQAYRYDKAYYDLEQVLKEATIWAPITEEAIEENLDAEGLIHVYEEFALTQEDISFDDDKRQATMSILKEGWSKNGWFYTKPILEEFKDALTEQPRMFLNHSVEKAQGLARPRRDYRDWASQVLEVNVIEEGGLSKLQAVTHVFEEPDGWLWERMKKFPQHCGASVDYIASYKQGTADGREGRIVESCRKFFSADHVLFPSAGGGVEVTEEEIALKVFDADHDPRTADKARTLEAAVETLDTLLRRDATPFREVWSVLARLLRQIAQNSDLDSAAKQEAVSNALDEFKKMILEMDPTNLFVGIVTSVYEEEDIAMTLKQFRLDHPDDAATIVAEIQEEVRASIEKEVTEERAGEEAKEKIAGLEVKVTEAEKATEVAEAEVKKMVAEAEATERAGRWTKALTDAEVTEDTLGEKVISLIKAAPEEDWKDLLSSFKGKAAVVEEVEGDPKVDEEGNTVQVEEEEQTSPRQGTLGMIPGGGRVKKQAMTLPVSEAEKAVPKEVTAEDATAMFKHRSRSA